MELIWIFTSKQKIMLNALDNKGNRIEVEKGKIGVCPYCKSKVKAYCGNIITHHWKHYKKNKNCDSWKEHESEWHRNWKKSFPRSWQEIIIIKDNEKHIADIKTKNGIVLELQNSSISSATIKIRENFYKNMIWLINAYKFKNNFNIKSIVRQKLKKIENDSAIYYYEDNTKINPKINKLQKAINTINSKLSEKEIEKRINNQAINDILEFNRNIDKNIKTYIYTPYVFGSLLSSFNFSQTYHLKTLIQKKNSLISEKHKLVNLISGINNLENCKAINYNDYKYIKPNQIEFLSHYENCLFIKKDTEQDLFPLIKIPKDKIDFSMLRRDSEYKLIINLEKELVQNELELESINFKLSESENQIKSIKKKLKIELKSHLDSKVEKHNKTIDSIKKEINNLRKQSINYKKEIVLISEEEERKKIEENISLEEDLENEKFEIMKRYKGLYYYYWKHRRHSWDYSTKNIYFDFGDTIFEMTNDTIFRKLSKNDFIKKVKNMTTI